MIDNRHKQVDWRNPLFKVSKYFTVKELIYLPKWDRLATEDDGLTATIKTNLIELAETMDDIREFLGLPINVHVTYRPKEYNALIGGAPISAHTSGLAMDFSISKKSSDEIRLLLRPKLEYYNVRMENLPGASWVHIDKRDVAVTGNRYFKP